MEEQLNLFANTINPLTLLVGVIFVIAAVVVYIFPPKKINYFYGYRTASSMKSQEAWDFSQRYSAVIMFRLGLILLGASLINLLLPMSQNVDFILGAFLIVLGCVFLIWATENNIKKKFPNP